MSGVQQLSGFDCEYSVSRQSSALCTPLTHLFIEWCADIETGSSRHVRAEQAAAEQADLAVIAHQVRACSSADIAPLNHFRVVGRNATIGTRNRSSGYIIATAPRSLNCWKRNWGGSLTKRFNCRARNKSLLHQKIQAQILSMSGLFAAGGKRAMLLNFAARHHVPVS